MAKKPTRVTVQYKNDTSVTRSLILEQAQRLLRIEKKNGFDNWELPKNGKYEFINGFISVRNTGVNQESKGEGAVAPSAAG